MSTSTTAATTTVHATVRSNGDDGVGADSLSNLSQFLPTGTLLTLQSVSPLFTNNGDCGKSEKYVTMILIGVLVISLIATTFTDSIMVSSGKVYQGMVTTKGLYSSRFETANIEGVHGSFYDAKKRYFINFFDVFNALVTVGVFCTLAILTPPVSTCYFPDISPTIIKSAPVLVSLVASGYFSIAPPPRKGIGNTDRSSSRDIVKDNDDDLETTISSTRRPPPSTVINSTDPSANAAPAVVINPSSSDLEAGA